MLGICESNITNDFPFEDTAVNLFSQPDRSDQLYSGGKTAAARYATISNNSAAGSTS